MLLVGMGSNAMGQATINFTVGGAALYTYSILNYLGRAGNRRGKNELLHAR